jgi:hypothetical protein
VGVVLQKADVFTSFGSRDVEQRYRAVVKAMNQFATDEGGFNPDDYVAVVNAVTALDEQMAQEMSQRS